MKLYFQKSIDSIGEGERSENRENFGNRRIWMSISLKLNTLMEYTMKSRVSNVWVSRYFLKHRTTYILKSMDLKGEARSHSISGKFFKQKDLTTDFIETQQVHGVRWEMKFLKFFSQSAYQGKANGKTAPH